MYFPHIQIIDIIEILIITVIVYEIMLWIKNTKAWMLLRGILMLGAFILVAWIFQMNTILYLAKASINVLAVAAVVVFQPELRRALEKLGEKNLFSNINPFDKNRENERFSDETMVGNVQVQGIYDNIGKTDSLGFTLKLVIPEKYNWTELYKDYTHVVMQKSCPFDIHNFSGWCMVTSTFYNQYLNNVTNRLIKTEVVEDEENTVLLKDVYYKGYNLKLKFNTNNILEPKVEMDDQIAGETGEAFGTIYGDGKLRISQPSFYTSYYNTCQNYVLQYVTMSVDNKDGSSFGTVGTFITMYEWISDAEAEKLKEQGY